MLRALRMALPASWLLALVLLLLFARAAALPTLILGALVVSAWWAAFGAALGPRAGSHPRSARPPAQSARNAPPSTGSITPET
jgi:hypothetical protein